MKRFLFPFIISTFALTGCNSSSSKSKNKGEKVDYDTFVQLVLEAEKVEPNHTYAKHTRTTRTAAYSGKSVSEYEKLTPPGGYESEWVCVSGESSMDDIYDLNTRASNYILEYEENPNSEFYILDSGFRFYINESGTYEGMQYSFVYNVKFDQYGCLVDGSYKYSETLDLTSEYRVTIEYK